MGLATLIKQPSENRLYSMEFAANMAPGETITSVSSVTASPTGAGHLDLSAQPVANGTQAQQRISGGTSGVVYKVTIVVVTSDGNTLEGEGYLQVRSL